MTIDSVDALMAAIDQAAPGADANAKLLVADKIIRLRFVHDYSYFRVDQDWVAAALGLFWSDLASPVRPDDILRFRRAACSQQAMVFQEVARRLGFDTGTAFSPGHFMPIVRQGGQWWVYDADREIRVQRYPADLLLRGDPRLDTIYAADFASMLRAGAARGKNGIRDINRNPAPQATMLHAVTAFTSRFGWLVCLAAWMLVNLLRRRPAGRGLCLAPA